MSQHECFEFIKSNGGCTVKDISLALNTSVSNVSLRVNKLLRFRLVRREPVTEFFQSVRGYMYRMAVYHYWVV